MGSERRRSPERAATGATRRFRPVGRPRSSGKVRPKPVLQLSVRAWAIRDPPRFTIANANGDGAHMVLAFRRAVNWVSHDAKEP